jgi:hypothetical protein
MIENKGDIPVPYTVTNLPDWLQLIRCKEDSDGSHFDAHVDTATATATALAATTVTTTTTTTTTTIPLVDTRAKKTLSELIAPPRSKSTITFKARAPHCTTQTLEHTLRIENLSNGANKGAKFQEPYSPLTPHTPSRTGGKKVLSGHDLQTYKELTVKLSIDASKSVELIPASTFVLKRNYQERSLSIEDMISDGVWSGSEVPDKGAPPVERVGSRDSMTLSGDGGVGVGVGVEGKSSDMKHDVKDTAMSSTSGTTDNRTKGELYYTLVEDSILIPPNTLSRTRVSPQVEAVTSRLDQSSVLCPIAPIASIDVPLITPIEEICDIESKIVCKFSLRNNLNKNARVHFSGMVYGL